MAKRQSLSWAELRVGILVIASFALLTAAVFFIGGEAGFFAKTYSLTAHFESANGMNKGADVWLEGVPVGSVSSVTVTGSADPVQSVEIVMSIKAEYQDFIRTDSVLTIGTIGLLGNGYVDIVRGYDGAVVPDGGVIQGRSGGSIRDIIEGTDDIIANMGILSTHVQEITAGLSEGQGTLGKLFTDTGVYDNLNTVTAEASLLVRDARTGDGTIGRLMSDESLYTDARDLIARLDAVIVEVEDGDGTIGQLLSNPAIFEEINEVVHDLGLFVERLNEGEGTLALLSNDDTLYVEASEAMENISILVSNVANSEGTAGRLINDPALYNNMNTLISEILKLVYDFRQDPEKFLTINFRLL